MTTMISATHSTPLPLPIIRTPHLSDISEHDESTTKTTSSRPGSTSSHRHHNLLTRLRPLPFQYIFSLYHTKSTSTTTPTLLASSIPDIATFYKIYNNFPWEALPLRDAVHIFRSGVKPLWEDDENIDGGCWVVKVRRDGGKAIRCWEELCLMVCGGELQGVVCGGEFDPFLSPSSRLSLREPSSVDSRSDCSVTILTIFHAERDHILGISYSPRLYVSHISIWTKNGDNKRSIEALQRTILSRLSEDLRPTLEGEYYYKKHREHQGFGAAREPAISPP